MNIKLPYSKSMYAEHTDEHFKLYCPIHEENIFVNVYVKKDSKNNVPYIFEMLYEKYIKDGLSNKEAVIRAQYVVTDFFDICAELSKKSKEKKGKRPFKFRLTSFDPKRIKKKSFKK